MKPITVRLPDDLHARVKAAAEMERRSINAQILWCIEQHTEDQDLPEGGALSAGSVVE
jgi:predicted HicB family RNase H-like nuclease